MTRPSSAGAVPWTMRLAVAAAMACLALALTWARLGAEPAGRASAGVAAPAMDGDARAAWFCPMHPAVTASEPGRCRWCAMPLVAGHPFDTDDYLVDVRTSPRAVRPNERFTIRATVRHPRSGDAISAFETVHDRPFHLFVIAQDGTVFQHLHPEQRDGEWSIETTVPHAGYYRVVSDFVPTGGSPQFLTRTIATARYVGDLMSQMRPAPVTASATTVAGSLAAALAVEPARPIAGEHVRLRFTLTDARTGAPVSDLQPYLGAFGHAVVTTEDVREAAHVHPSAGTDQDVSRDRGGPMVPFDLHVPQPGVYRVWAQFRRGGTVETMAFTFRAHALDEVEVRR